ncbi:hypothetical protein NEOKW01_1612 [Nematocida sp. AWRm80]|nr:hypothetical protein NEOKW01_1612 [Nematocida sp. AWRm80]
MIFDRKTEFRFTEAPETKFYSRFSRFLNENKKTYEKKNHHLLIQNIKGFLYKSGIEKCITSDSNSVEDKKAYVWCIKNIDIFIYQTPNQLYSHFLSTLEETDHKKEIDTFVKLFVSHLSEFSMLFHRVYQLHENDSQQQKIDIAVFGQIAHYKYRYNCQTVKFFNKWKRFIAKYQIDLSANAIPAGFHTKTPDEIYAHINSKDIQEVAIEYMTLLKQKINKNVSVQECFEDSDFVWLYSIKENWSSLEELEGKFNNRLLGSNIWTQISTLKQSGIDVLKDSIYSYIQALKNISKGSLKTASVTSSRLVKNTPHVYNRWEALATKCLDNLRLEVNGTANKPLLDAKNNAAYYQGENEEEDENINLSDLEDHESSSIEYITSSSNTDESEYNSEEQNGNSDKNLSNETNTNHSIYSNNTSKALKGKRHDKNKSNRNALLMAGSLIVIALIIGVSALCIHKNRTASRK